jgi:tetratricopeptide (TPR) repeat protein
MKKSVSWTDLCRRCAVLLFFLGVCLGSGVCRAQLDFDHHYARAYRAYEAGRFAEAIEAFEAAYALNPLPRLLINLGNAHRKLGQDQDALICYQRYLQLEPRAPPALRAKVEASMAQVRARARPLGEVRPPPPPPVLSLTATAPPVSPAFAPASRGRDRGPGAGRWTFIVLGAVAAVVAAGVVTGVVIGSQQPPPGLPVGEQTYPGMQ